MEMFSLDSLSHYCIDSIDYKYLVVWGFLHVFKDLCLHKDELILSLGKQFDKKNLMSS